LTATLAATLAATFCAGVVTGCGGAQVVSTKDLGRCTILATNDSEAHFDGDKLQGGPPIRYLGPLARVAAEKKRLQKRRKGVLLVSAGDVLQGRYMQRTDGDRKRAARASWQMYERAGYDLTVLGNHEFDAGPAVVAHAIGGLKSLRVVVSNLSEGKGTALHNPAEKLFATTVVRACGGLKIGFLGLLTPSTRNISDFGDTRFEDPSDPVVPAARRAIAALRKQGVDAVVALTHLGIGHEIKLAKKVAGIDVVIGGHSHTLLKHEKWVGDTLVVQAGARFSHLGHVELHGEAGGGIARERTSWYVRKIDLDMQPDPAITDAVDKLREAYPAEVTIGQRTRQWVLRGNGRRAYGTRVARSVGEWLHRRGTKIDGTILNAGGLRTAKTYEIGPVTNMEVEAIHPFRNRIVIASMSSQQLRILAEHACTKSHRGGGGLRVMLSGLQITCDASKPRIRYRKDQGKRVGVLAMGQRIRALLVGGKPIVDGGTYKIATNNYMARGGSGYYAFTIAPRACTDGSDFLTDSCAKSPTLADIVKDAVKRGVFDL
jgi:2',3'-cyclic-nucleotide 2'-phosphodiesterase (5'-nucleotidase family)